MSIGYLFSSRHPWLLESQQVLKLSPLLLHHWRCHRWLIHLCRGSKPAYGSQYTSKFHSLEPHNLHLSRFLGCLCKRTNCLRPCTTDPRRYLEQTHWLSIFHLRWEAVEKKTFFFLPTGYLQAVLVTAAESQVLGMIDWKSGCLLMCLYTQSVANVL